jgi:hypothetical protein
MVKPKAFDSQSAACMVLSYRALIFCSMNWMSRPTQRTELKFLA